MINSIEHSRYIELIELYFAKEIAGEEEIDLLEHLNVCSDCTELFNLSKKLYSNLEDLQNEEPGELLVSNAREKLFSAINAKSAEKRKLQIPLIINSLFKNTTFRIAATLVIGLGLGYIFFAPNHNEKMVIQQNKELTSKVQSSVTPAPENNKSNNSEPQVTKIVDPNFFKAVTPRTLIDEAISALVNENPGIRLRGIEAIKELTNSYKVPEVKIALIKSLSSDPLPSVKMESIKLLAKYSFDNEIKLALIKSMITEENSAVRILAVDILLKHYKNNNSIDSDIDKAFMDIKNNEESNYLKIKVTNFMKGKRS